MIDLYACLRPALMVMDPERAHRMTLSALKTGFAPTGAFTHPCLEVQTLGHLFPNPLGLAAGFDKDAEVIAPLLRMGFGFVEAGTVTPLAQEGNPKPRVFRDVQNQSVINRMGFPGAGLAAFAERVSAYRADHPNPTGVLGVNIGINKDTASSFEDYQQGIVALAPLADYMTVNVSSPNTPGLRDLQRESVLDNLLAGLVAARDAVEMPDVARPALLLKVAPDLTRDQKESIATLCLRHHVDGLIVSNTTVDRPDALSDDLRAQTGGLSGRLLKRKAHDALFDFYQLTGGKLPLIGVGGIETAEDVWERMAAGASLVQVYTSLIYQGPKMVTRILQALAARVQEEGLDSIAAVTGMAHHASGGGAHRGSAVTEASA